MLCRRCGMESSTTDVCEWCKRPMLPPGAQLSGQTQPPDKQAQEAAEPPGRSLGEVTGADAAQEEDPAQQHPKSEAELRPLGGHSEQVVAPEPPAPPPQEAAPAAEADFLEPPPTKPTPAAPPKIEAEAPAQEPQQTEPEQPESSVTGPSHGLAEEATATSIDISEYMGDDNSIFRPIVREEPKSQDTKDLLAQRHKRRLDEAREPEISENTRLLRCLIAGLVVAIPIALIQYLVPPHNTVTTLFTSVQLSRGPSFVAALKYGIVSGIIFGFGIGALLVRLKKGPGVGFVVGVVLGLSAMGNGFWGALAGAIIGIYAGKVATVGVRRTVNV
ncbi:MAG: hypothetical protein JXA57_12350 [Armatimonadetes bacterium]|nr:hypothetical protein [Armatimonadota bacterium]